MKILAISNLFPPHVLGGYEILCGQVCRGLSSRGHTVKVLTSDHGVDAGAPVSESEDVIRRLKLYLPFDHPARLMRWSRRATGARNHRITREVLQAEKPDLVFVWSQLRLTLGAARAALDSQIPTVFTFNDEHVGGYVPQSFGWSPRQMAGYLLDHLILPANTLRGMELQSTTCISQLVKKKLMGLDVPIPNSRVIYQGIPLEKFPSKQDIGRFHEPVKLLYAGQLHEYKGVHTLIQAAHGVAATSGCPAIEVSIVGDGSPDYVAFLRRMGQEGPAQIHFHGKLPHREMGQWYRSHDVFVFPSIWQEPFGLTHLEAMASGTPVISTFDGGHGEFLREGSNALLFEKGNVRHLEEKILQLIGKPAEAVELARRTRQMVEERFSLERYIDDLEALLLECRTGRAA